MGGCKIQKIVGREILDSRGNPTVEVDVTLKAAHLAEHQFLLEPLLVKTKHLSCAMETKNATWEKEFSRQLKMLTK